MKSAQKPKTPAEAARATATRQWIFGFVLALLGLWVARPFLLQIAFAAILAIALWPLYRWLAQSAGKTVRTIFLPVGFTVAIGLVLVFPLAVLGAEAVRDSARFGQWVAGASRNGIPAPAWLNSIPIIGTWLDFWWKHHVTDPHGAAALLNRIDAGAVVQWVAATAGTLLSGTMFLLVTLLAFLIIIRDAAHLGQTACSVARRLYGPFGDRFVDRLAEAIRGTVNGTVFVALGEGLLIGVGYAFIGLPHLLALTVATIGFALVPFGAWAAFGIASIGIIIEGKALAGALLFGYGSAIMLTGDNLVQPAVIGKSIRLPFLWTFVGIFGGMYSFGLVGLFIGPAIMAALYLVWSDWQGESPRRTTQSDVSGGPSNELPG